MLSLVVGDRVACKLLTGIRASAWTLVNDAEQAAGHADPSDQQQSAGAQHAAHNLPVIRTERRGDGDFLASLAPLRTPSDRTHRRRQVREASCRRGGEDEHREPRLSVPRTEHVLQHDHILDGDATVAREVLS
jgi:hypothetical protein